MSRVTIRERTTAPPPACACARRDAPGTGVCGYALVRERPAAYPPAPCGASVSRCRGYGHLYEKQNIYTPPPYGLTALAPGGGACRALSRPSYHVALSVPSARPVHSLSPRYACPPHCGYPAHTGGLVGALSMRLRARAPGWATLSALRADGDGAALRGALGLRAPARGGVRLRYGACASRRAGVTVASAGAHAGATVASAGAHAGVTSATLRGAPRLCALSSSSCVLSA